MAGSATGQAREALLGWTLDRWSARTPAADPSRGHDRGVYQRPENGVKRILGPMGRDAARQRGVMIAALDLGEPRLMFRLRRPVSRLGALLLRPVRGLLGRSGPVREERVVLGPGILEDLAGKGLESSPPVALLAARNVRRRPDTP